ncbi:hypothetical protein, partial [Bacillus atrophaeus]|uniref:hypothetical protein n=1 Tax=Bacillus atrophaeus TaxID=1452 RepID=UPI002280962E
LNKKIAISTYLAISRLTCLIWDVWGTKVELQTLLSKKIFTVIILHGIICIMHTKYVCIIK